MSRRKKLLTSVIVIWLAATFAIAAVILAATGQDVSDLTGLLTPKPPAELQSAEAAVTVIDVGQGSALLIKLQQQNRSIVIDAGDSFAENDLVRALKRQGVEAIDLLIITHPHSDHFGGAEKLFETFRVAKLWLPKIPEKLQPTNSSYFSFLEAVEKEGCAVELKSRPEKLKFSEKAYLSLLDGFVSNPEDLNDTSLCVRFDYGNASFLVTGDGEQPLELQLLKNKTDLDTDIFVAGHHGSATSNTLEFLNAVSPKASAVSVGADNEYGHPDRKVISRLSQFGSVYRTDINGDISFLTDGKTITVRSGEKTDLINAGDD